MTNEPWHRYAEDVTQGKIVACEYVKASCRRYLADLERTDLTFRLDRVERAIKFIAMLRHFVGKHNGEPFTLTPWQSFIIANLFGWYYTETNRRRYTNAYIEVARKQGKTSLCAAIALYLLIADGEPSAEILFAANAREQAKIAFNIASQYAKQLADESIIKAYRNDLKFFPTNSVMKVLSSDDSKLDGANASGGIVDEYHAAKTSRVKDVIASSQGMRKNPMLIVITTAGFDKNGPCYALRQTATEILGGAKGDDSQFIIIYTLDDGDDWTDSKNWIKANPNLGVTITMDYLKAQVIKALNNPNEESGIRTKLLNQWLDAEAAAWLPSNKVMKRMKPLKLEDFDSETPIYIGVDLGSVSDLTAVTLLQLKDTYYFKTYYYLPQSQMSESPNAEKYKQWRNGGYINTTEGATTDYSVIANFIIKLSETHNIAAVFFDKWNATHLITELSQNGINCVEFSQSIGNMSGAVKEFERLILSDDIFIDSNPINLWCISNAIVKEDWNENRKIVKTTYSNKIDGAVAMITALGGYLKAPKFSNEIMTL